ncbi:sll1863 family stress response protein [Roseivivax sediminis]|uniref:Coiled coil domain-containing protein n=1 Tax=Roseivivax sediminis TaxID=936889 RepID=A0A1I2BJI5_9RHOB|nr:coiled coil domain-containing protein [Roseivivax sediminis]SFE55380.1 hypothetical protein SAMN04515678_11143 [Roseivivax sediminis]
MTDHNDPEDKSAYQRRVEAKLDEWQAEIDRLRAKARGEAAEKQIEYEREAKDLEIKKQEMRQRYDELKRNSGEAWRDVRQGLDSAWDSVEAAFKKARARF